MTEEPSSPSLDVDHLADLANLPLDDEEREELSQACHELLDAFHLEATEDPDVEPDTLEPFEDEAQPWPEEGIEAILDAFPDRDGRSLRP